MEDYHAPFPFDRFVYDGRMPAPPPAAGIVDSSRAILVESLRGEKRHIRVSLRGWAPMTGRVEAVDSLYLTVRTRSGVRVESLAAVDSVWARR